MQAVETTTGRVTEAESLPLTSPAGKALSATASATEPNGYLRPSCSDPAGLAQVKRDLEEDGASSRRGGAACAGVNVSAR